MSIVGKLVEPWRRPEYFAKRRWYPAFYDAVFSFALFFLGMASGLVVAEPWRVEATPVNRIRIGSLEVSTGHKRHEGLLKAARARLQSIVALKGLDFVNKFTWADLGARVDFDILDRALIDLARPNNPMTRHFHENSDKNAIPKIEMPIALVSQAAVESLVAIKDTIDHKPRNAVFDFKANRVVEEEFGRSLDVYETLHRLDKALEDGAFQVEIAVEKVPASVTEQDLKNIKIEEIVGFFETRYSQMLKDRDRTHNVKLGASMLDGQIIMPGQVFSLNDTLGDRNEARGFRYAPVIAGGVLVEGMGGGTCQIASTLNAAAFFAGLIVVERRPHSRPSAYIKLGLDATVSYPAIDLKLENPFNFPAAIHFTADEGALRAEIRGLERPFIVTFLRTILGTRPFPVRIIEDSKLARGKEVVTQNGIPGYSVQRYQIIEKDKVAYHFQTTDKYPPTTQFIHKGIAEPGSIGKNDTDAPRPDTHNPYHASTYLRMVQGPDELWYEQSHE
jgi:vancomycin resistance protein YoaR